MAALQQEQGRVGRSHRVQIDIEGDEIGIPAFEIDQVLVCTSSAHLRQAGSGFNGELASSGVDI
jgi:hypothetical protein